MPASKVFLIITLDSKFKPRTYRNEVNGKIDN